MTTISCTWKNYTKSSKKLLSVINTLPQQVYLQTKAKNMGQPKNPQLDLVSLRKIGWGHWYLLSASKQLVLCSACQHCMSDPHRQHNVIPQPNEINYHSGKLNIWFPPSCCSHSTSRQKKPASVISGNEDNGRLITILIVNSSLRLHHFHYNYLLTYYYNDYYCYS